MSPPDTPASSLAGLRTIHARNNRSVLCATSGGASERWFISGGSQWGILHLVLAGLPIIKALRICVSKAGQALAGHVASWSGLILSHRAEVHKAWMDPSRVDDISRDKSLTGSKKLVGNRVWPIGDLHFDY